MLNLRELTGSVNKYLGSTEAIEVKHDGSGYFAIMVDTNLGKKHIGEWMCARETKAHLEGMRLMALMVGRPEAEPENEP